MRQHRQRLRRRQSILRSGECQIICEMLLLEINKNQIFSLCVQIYRPSASDDCLLPLVDVSSPSAVISLFCGLQHQAWFCKALSPGSNGPGWDKYPGCETKSILMSLSVQSVLSPFLQNARPRRVMERGHSFLGGPGPSCAVPQSFLTPLGAAAAVSSHVSQK